MRSFPALAWLWLCCAKMPCRWGRCSWRLEVWIKPELVQAQQSLPPIHSPANIFKYFTATVRSFGHGAVMVIGSLVIG